MTDPTNPFQRRQEVQEHLAMSAPSSADLSLRLAKFFQHIAKTAVFAGDTLDLFSVADLAVRLGLLVDVNFDPDIHENHFGAGVEPGDPWFLIAPDVLAALKDIRRELIASVCFAASDLQVLINELLEPLPAPAEEGER